jgi:Flp pilus assembly pilin Flp
MLQRIDRFCRDEKAAAMAEYGILASVIAIVVAGAAAAFGQDTSTMFGHVAAFVAALPVSP